MSQLVTNRSYSKSSKTWDFCDKWSLLPMKHCSPVSADAGFPPARLVLSPAPPSPPADAAALPWSAPPPPCASSPPPHVWRAPHAVLWMKMRPREIRIVLSVNISEAGLYRWLKLNHENTFSLLEIKSKLTANISKLHFCYLLKQHFS